MRSWWVKSDCKGTKTAVSSVLQVGQRSTTHGCTNKMALSEGKAVLLSLPAITDDPQVRKVHKFTARCLKKTQKPQKM